MISAWLRNIWQRVNPGFTPQKETRLVISFPQSSKERILQLKEQTHAATCEMVISDALRTWASITDEVAAGTVFWVTRSNGEQVPIEFISHDSTATPSKKPFGSHIVLIVDNTDKIET